MSLKKSIDNSSPSKNPLKTIRKNIDRIDDKIHDLLIERAEVVEKVVEEKKKSKESNIVVYRPAREHEILKRIIQRHKGNLPKNSLINIWRNLISSYIAMQAELTLSFSYTLEKIVNNHFGVDIKKKKAKTDLDALKSLDKNEVNISILPYPSTDNDWWVKFKCFADIFVIGSISESYIGIPQALILGKQNIEYTDKNIVLATIEIKSKEVQQYTSLLSSENYTIIAERPIDSYKSIIIFASKAITEEEIEDKIEVIENNKLNLQDSLKIMGVYAVFK